VLARLTPEHLSSPLAARALEWIRAHLDEPLAGLSNEDGELVALVTQVVMEAQREPASRDAIEMNFMLLEQRRIEDQIRAAEKAGETERSAALHRERAELGERIMRPEHWGDSGASEAA
jgi:hypothetical protein